MEKKIFYLKEQKRKDRNKGLESPFELVICTCVLWKSYTNCNFYACIFVETIAKDNNHDSNAELICL